MFIVGVSFVAEPVSASRKLCVRKYGCGTHCCHGVGRRRYISIARTLVIVYCVVTNVLPSCIRGDVSLVYPVTVRIKILRAFHGVAVRIVEHHAAVGTVVPAREEVISAGGSFHRCRAVCGGHLRGIDVDAGVKSFFAGITVPRKNFALTASVIYLHAADGFFCHRSAIGIKLYISVKHKSDNTVYMCTVVGRSSGALHVRMIAVPSIPVKKCSLKQIKKLLSVVDCAADIKAHDILTFI